MQDSLVHENFPKIAVPFSQYVSIVSLSCVKHLSEVLDNVSFSFSPVVDNTQLVSLHYREWSSLYTLWWYDIYYDLRIRTTIWSFATSNLYWIWSSYKQNSQFASKMHLLRTPVSWIWSKLFDHLIHMAQIHNMPSIKISSDAISVPFYKKMAIKFSDSFAYVDENYTRHTDGWCDFTFMFR